MDAYRFDMTTNECGFLHMCEHGIVENEMLSVLEENFQFSKEERSEALLLCLQILEQETLFDE